MAFEVGQTYKTRDGRDVQIVARMGLHSGSYPLLGVITHTSGAQTAETYQEDGRVCVIPGSYGDLIPPDQFMYVNVRAYGDVLVVGGGHTTRKRADEMASVDRIACQKVKIVRGQFDE